MSPHSGFGLPEQEERVPARESNEVRCLVLWEDQGLEWDKVVVGLMGLGNVGRLVAVG